MTNNEIKIKVTNFADYLECLNRIGAAYHYKMHQVDYYLKVGTSKQKVRVINGKEYQLISYTRSEKSGRKESEYTIKVINNKVKTALLKRESVLCVVSKTREL